MESEILKALIDFFYSGGISITNDNVLGLLAASSQLLLPNLVQACGQFLADFCLDEENCLRIFAIATSQNFAGNLGWLEAEAMRYIQLHFESIWQRHSVQKSLKKSHFSTWQSRLGCFKHILAPKTNIWI